MIWDECQSTVDAIEKCGNMGLIVSIVFGPSSGHGTIYSVQVMNPLNGREFADPIGASDFATIATILNSEVPELL
jgi:hypothetical protein